MNNNPHIGASLYVPATHRKLLSIANGKAYPELRNVIFCTEDAIFFRDLERAMDNLRTCLSDMMQSSTLHRFVRVRDPRMLERVLALAGAEKLDGFVLPKVIRENLADYFAALTGTRYRAMLTLETKEVFDVPQLLALRDALLESGYQENILALRIGGNDLLALLGIRRPRHLTIYNTPLALTIAQIVTVFKPYGFHITAPVFEHIDSLEVLRAEVLLDQAHGLCGKTAIHPSQVPVVDRLYRIADADLELAERILDAEDAVFTHQGSMCEYATHVTWAKHIVAQAEQGNRLYASCRTVPDGTEPPEGYKLKAGLRTEN